MHVQNQSMAQGTAFAIAYKSNLTEIEMEDLVVFSVLEQYCSHCSSNARRCLRADMIVQHAVEPYRNVPGPCWHAGVSGGRVYLRTSLGTARLRAAEHVSIGLRALVRAMILNVTGICKASSARRPALLATKYWQKLSLTNGAPTMRHHALRAQSKWSSSIVRALTVRQAGDC